QIDRFVPLAKRRAALSDEGQRHAAGTLARKREREPGDCRGPGAERRNRRPYAVLHVADMQILSVHRWAGLAHLRREDAPDHLRFLAHRDRHAEIADERRDHVASPLVAVEKTVSPAKADGGSVNRLLPERP